jgi:hypothetical protein
VLTLVDNIEAVEIGRLDDAIELAEYYLSEALRLVCDLDDPDAEPNFKDKQRLLEWCRSNKATALVRQPFF